MNDKIASTGSVLVINLPTTDHINITAKFTMHIIIYYAYDTNFLLCMYIVIRMYSKPMNSSSLAKSRDSGYSTSQNSII